VEFVLSVIHTMFQELLLFLSCGEWLPLKQDFFFVFIFDQYNDNQLSEDRS
jgi:hypothetical protein